jgi:Thioredoxin domain-containing protein
MKTTVDITEANFEAEVLNSNQPVLVEFATGWAFPSMMLNGVLEEIASESDCLKIARVKLDDSPNLGLWYGIRCIPTVLCFVDGEERSEFLERQANKQSWHNCSQSLRRGPQSDPRLSCLLSTLEGRRKLAGGASHRSQFEM